MASMDGAQARTSGRRSRATTRVLGNDHSSGTANQLLTRTGESIGDLSASLKELRP
jgi:hypothetical protein